MSIKSQGGVFGRNPTFNDVTVDGDLSIAGTLSVGGETITGLSYQGGWNASTNTPDIAASSPVTGQFWIVSADGSTNVGGITNWTSGDWALYDGSAWQRVEGGNTDLTTGVQGQLAVANGGTGAADATNARSNLGLVIGTDVEAADATILKSAAIGVTVQGYDADTAKYDDTTANFTGTLQNGGSNVVVDSDIGSTVQAYDANILTSSDIGSTVQGYDADTAKLDTTQTFTATQSFAAVNTGNLSVSGTQPLTINTTSNNQIRFQVNGSNTGQYLSTSTYPHWFTDSTGGSDLLKIDTSGNVILNSGSGIDFSATSGTGTSELLDDYEEGTFTATATPQTSGSVTLNTSYDTLSYTKIGRIVTINGEIRITSVSSPVGNRLIINLPFAVGNLTDFAGRANGATYGYISSTVISQPFRCPEGNSELWLDVNCATLASGNEFGFSFSYPTS